MPANIDGVKLQLAMAFGQGAGAMLADAEALETLLANESEILLNAMPSWQKSHWAFTELVRILGQLSATHAAGVGRALIQWPDIAASLPSVMELCPCVERDGRQTPTVT